MLLQQKRLNVCNAILFNLLSYTFLIQFIPVYDAAFNIYNVLHQVYYSSETNQTFVYNYSVVLYNLVIQVLFVTILLFPISKRKLDNLYGVNNCNIKFDKLITLNLISFKFLSNYSYSLHIINYQSIVEPLVFL